MSVVSRAAIVVMAVGAVQAASTPKAWAQG